MGARSTARRRGLRRLPRPDTDNLRIVSPALRITAPPLRPCLEPPRHRPHLPACQADLSTITLAKTKNTSLRTGMCFYGFRMGLVHGILNKNVMVTMVVHPLCGNKRLLAVVRLVRKIVLVEIFFMRGVAVELWFAWQC